MKWTGVLVVLGLSVSGGLVQGAPAETVAQCHSHYAKAKARGTNASFADYRKTHCPGLAGAPTRPARPSAHANVRMRQEPIRRPPATRGATNGPVKDAKAAAHDEGVTTRLERYFDENRAENTPSAASSKAAGIGSALTPAIGGGVVFPSRISPEFASLTAGRARLKTCAAQYEANKEHGGNGNLRWIQPGGGYWSECNARLED